MKQFFFITLLVVTAILLCACPEKEIGHRYVTFTNSSDKEIVCQTFVSGNITEADTLFQCRTGVVGISPNSSYDFCSLHNSWEVDFNAMSYMQFLVMDARIYDQYIEEPCDTIRKYIPVLHIYSLTLEDLQRMNWTVVYPPEE